MDFEMSYSQSIIQLVYILFTPDVFKCHCYMLLSVDFPLSSSLCFVLPPKLRWRSLPVKGEIFCPTVTNCLLTGNQVMVEVFPLIACRLH